jgi:hypothetical protein
MGEPNFSFIMKASTHPFCFSENHRHVPGVTLLSVQNNFEPGELDGPSSSAKCRIEEFLTAREVIVM